MSTIATIDPRTTSIDPRTTSSRGISPARVLRSEWIKLRSLRSSWLTVGAAIATMIITSLAIALTSASATQVEGNMAAPEAPLQGWMLAQLIVGVLGALVVTSEYGTGMIRSTFAAVPKRLPVLGAKTVVFGLVALITMTATAFAAFFVGQAILAGEPQAASINDPGVLRAVAGTGAYLALTGLLGTALGWILRSTAATIGVLTALLLVVPTLVLLLPAGIQDIASYLPSNAGQALITTAPDGALLGPWAGLGVLSAWIAGTLAVAAVLVRRRDV